TPASLNAWGAAANELSPPGQNERYGSPPPFGATMHYVHAVPEPTPPKPGVTTRSRSAAGP
ncbi:hypothetical protein FOA52_006969, partial [Chlamydomonas sp. UWO 241]